MDQRIQAMNANGGRHTNNQNQSARQQRVAQQRNTNTSAQTNRTIGSRSDYAITRTPSALHVGDMIRGEITDLRNNEIAITLEDNTTIRAQISDSTSYSIGQIGTFRLTNIAGSTLTLENVSIGLSDTEKSMILKALEEAGLPSTEHNQNAVKALMDNMLPINRVSIQNLMQQSYDYKTEDMNTLALMNRLMMKMDEESVTQFSNYRNENYELLGQLDHFSKDIPALLHALADNSPAEAVSVFGKNLLSIGLNLSQPNVIQQNAIPSTLTTSPALADLAPHVQHDIITMLSNTAMTDETLTQLENGTLSLKDTLTMIRDAALSGTLTLSDDVTKEELVNQLNHIAQILEPASSESTINAANFVKNIVTISPDTLKAGPEVDGTASSTNNTDIDTSSQNESDLIQNEKSKEGFDASSTVEGESANTEALKASPFRIAGKFFQNLSDNAKHTLDALRSPKENTQEPIANKNTSLETLVTTFEKYSRNHDLLSHYLSANERNELADKLQHMPISKNLLSKIISGDATTKEVLTVIHNTVSLSDSEQTKQLFQSDVFERLFSKNLQSSWTITPEQLKNGELSDFYNKMRGQLEQFRNAIQTTLTGSDSEQMSGFARDIESNITFMKTLNETFSYFQLPLKLPNQDAHGDLYVYTQKKNLREHPERNSVLLHLKLDHLGEIDVKIDRNRYDVITNFSLNDEDSVNLFRINADMLKDALNMQGYSCQVQVGQKEEASPTIDDFINTKVNTHATTEMKRFSFDIRA